MTEHLDVLIVGAGISGIDAAYHLQRSCPGKTFAILEARDRLGGTWDLFRYPGIRSDSDMFTLGFPFRPWTGTSSIADGPAILRYVRETAEAFGIDKKIRYNMRVAGASWSDGRWTVELEDRTALTCSFLFVCSGYYDYAGGYTPEFPGRARFRGTIIHPQRWPESIELAGKRVVVIGSGATAMTLAPALAERGAHVTMLQRSPSYIMSLPATDPMLRYLGPQGTRWKNVLLGMALFSYCRKFPDRAKRLLVGQVAKQLGGASDIAHFTPTYNPWDQRLCLVPDADLFTAIRAGRLDIVTDHIASFTETGIALTSGATLDADIIVTATGLVLKAFGGIAFEVDGKAIDLATTMVYRGVMCSGMPNFAFATGYTNASWTLKCDLTSRYVCRLLNHMTAHGHAWCCPRRDPAVEAVPMLDFASGYVQRSIAQFPKQGGRSPWKLHQNYAVDFMLARRPIDEPAMAFGR